MTIKDDNDKDETTSSNNDQIIENNIPNPMLRCIDKHIKAKCLCFSSRCSVTLVACFGLMLLSAMHLSVARFIEFTEFSGILAYWVHFWAYLIVQIPIGILATRFSAYEIFGFAVLGTTFMNFLVPFTINWTTYLFLSIKLLQGCFEGTAIVSFYGMWRFWLPPLERTRLFSFAFIGQHIGVALGYRIITIMIDSSGNYLISPTTNLGFYIYFIIALIWYAFWLWLVFEKPRNNPTITKAELQYIEKSLGKYECQQMEPIYFRTIPWKSILNSLPVWAIAAMAFCSKWNEYWILSYQYTYLHDVFHYDTYLINLLQFNQICVLVTIIVIPISGVVTDYIRKSNKLNTTNVRKLFITIGYGGAAIAYILLEFSVSLNLSIFLLIFVNICNAIAFPNLYVNNIEIAPKYASIIFAITYGSALIGGAISTIIIEAITKILGWQFIFLHGAVVNLIGVIFYATFGSGNIQAWATKKPVNKSSIDSTTINLTNTIPSNNELQNDTTNETIET